MKMFECRICGHRFDSIPEDAIEIEMSGLGRGRRTYKLYRFSDGSIHDLRIVTVPDPPPAMQVEPPQAVKEPVEDINPPTPIVPEDDHTTTYTVMRQAFEKAFTNPQEESWDEDSQGKF